MKPMSPTEVHTSPALEVLVGPSLVHDGAVASTGRDIRAADATTTPAAARRAPLARLLAPLRGDKYMVDAYPPTAWPPKEG
jgi:hypothetical protein